MDDGSVHMWTMVVDMRTMRVCICGRWQRAFVDDSSAYADDGGTYADDGSAHVDDGGAYVNDGGVHMDDGVCMCGRW